jgi:hypothetical protein
MAPKFPRFKAGQVLISLRHLDTIAVLDTDTDAVVWATRGPWCGQHDAQFLDNGHMLIFDNYGSPKSSRVLEYDPLTQAIPWSYSGDPVLTRTRGQAQRLPNGNTLIAHAEVGLVLEVSREQEVVWSFFVENYVSSARRYSPAQVAFLKRGQ